MPRSKDELKAPTVREALDLLTVDYLKQLLSLLPTAERPTRKGELVTLIEQYLTGARLRELWNQLDDLQQLAVRETIWSAEGFFNPQRFRARYGQMPNFGDKKSRWSYRLIPSRLRLFIYATKDYGGSVSTVPEDLKQQLLAFVPPPAPPVLKSLEALPEHVEQTKKKYDFSSIGAEDDEDDFEADPEGYDDSPSYLTCVSVGKVPLITSDTERAAQQDLQTVLRLIDKGRIQVSDKTHQPSAATMDEIASLLRGDDYYEPPKKKKQWEQEIGPIKPFAWPLLVQAAKLAELSGRKLTLTRTGRAALGAPAAETLRTIWQRWLKSKLLDEFNRIDVIKGQHGRGRRGLTAAETRRRVIAEALRQCPVGRWISFGDFSRFMQAASFDFEVTREPWELYIADHNYGNLGHEGYHDWQILQARYLLCFLFEYVATLGLIDVAYVHPAGARNDYELWGTDDLAFLSRYDGLQYFRLNPLGAYCLGLADQYVPAQIEARAAFTVLPSLQIKVGGAALSPDETLLLETWAESEADDLWHLSHNKSLAAVESGHQIAELREFLQARDEQPLPETVEGFIARIERNARALTSKGAALLIECASPETADLIASDTRTRKLCLRAGDKHLVVKAEAEEQFRKALHQLGYGMPRV